MNPKPIAQLVSYIAPAAPATRRPATGDEAFLRPEIGFTPAWFRDRLGIDFGERWHTEVDYRRETVVAMRAELRQRFPGTAIGGIDQPEQPLDLLTGTFGATVVAAIYGLPLIYANDNWPNVADRHLSAAEVDALEPPDLDRNEFFLGLLAQVERIAALEGPVTGFINWQGIMNNAIRLRGQDLFIEMHEEPQRCHHLFDCLCTTMSDGLRRLRARQRDSGADYRFATVSNCMVNMLAPAHYHDLLLPYDLRLARENDSFGLHNCAWTADPYLDEYVTIPKLAYLDMGIGSDLPRARRLFPDTRRAIMYTPMDLANKSLAAIRDDLQRVARDYGPCDFVCADIETTTPDERVHQLLALCADISRDHAPSTKPEPT